MQVNLNMLQGRFERGYALDKHSHYSLPAGYNAAGHMQWHTRRTEVGEALYQLKYRHQQHYVLPLALAVRSHILPLLPGFGLIVPMASSHVRRVQPVAAIAHALGHLVGKPVFALLSKAKGAALLKNLRTRAEKDAVLTNTLILNRLIPGEGRWDTLLLDDLYDSGASVDAACDALRRYEKIGDIFVATLTWR